MGKLRVQVQLYIMLLYYILAIVFPIFLLFSGVIVYYPTILLILLMLSPIIFILLPITFKKKLHIGEFLATDYSFIIIIIFIVIILIYGYLINNYFERFSYTKWNNNNYCNLRYKMINSLEKRYELVGMNKKGIYNILGKTDNKICQYDYEENNKICYLVLETTMRNDFYCLYLDENGIVVDTEYKSIR